MNFTNYKKGFTLIELSLYMAMFSFILLVLLQIFTALLEKQVEVETTSSVQSDRAFILARLTYDITRADSITTPATPGAQGNTIQLVIDGQTVTYTQTNNNLTITTPTGTDSLNSFETIVPNLNFQRLGNVTGKNTVNITYTIESIVDTPQGRESKDVNTTIGIR